MTQCAAGHFFDHAKHTSCPYCGVGFDLGAIPATMPVRTEPVGAAKTVPLRPDDAPAPKTVPLSGPTPPGASALTPGVTRRLVREEIGMDPVVG